VGIVRDRSADRLFLCVATLLFAGSAVLTVIWCSAMSGMGGMPMPGGWTMSMTWMRMPGQTWTGVTASFLCMWGVMMIAMMLPSFAPTLWRYHQAVAMSATAHGSAFTTLAGLGYFSVWALLGAFVFPLGSALASLEMREPALARIVPAAAGMAILIAGALQFTGWKTRQLACCRAASDDYRRQADVSTAWRYGVSVGVHCVPCCANLMAILVIVGVMDVGAMALVTAGITLERLTIGPLPARVVGGVSVCAGMVLTMRAIQLV
jgi:predicted metal-binding membrane protein